MPHELKRKVVAIAPVRVDAAGGGTDAPPFVIDYGGCVVNLAITRHARVEAEVLPNSSEIVIESDTLGARTGAPKLEALDLDGVLDLPIAIIRRLAPPFGLRVRISTGALPGSGLGGSGALGVAMVGAISTITGRPLLPMEAAQRANSVERDDLRMAGGNQDSLAAAYGGINRIDYHPGGHHEVHRLRVEGDVIAALEARAVLVYTGQSHLSGNIHEGIRRDYADPNGRTRDALSRMFRIARASADALGAGDLNRWGELLTVNWEQHQRLHESCGNARLDEFFAAAAPFAVGGKTCGAGGGGCIIFLARENQRCGLEDALKKLGGELLPFVIDFVGLRVHEE